MVGGGKGLWGGGEEMGIGGGVSFGDGEREDGGLWWVIVE